MYVLRRSACYSCHILMKRLFSTQIFEKSSYTKFHANISSGSRVVPCGQTDGQIKDMTKLIVALGNTANVPKNRMMHGG